MISGYRPFKGEEEIKKGIISYDPDSFPDINNLIEMWTIIQECLEPLQWSRITIGALKTPDSIEPWVKGIYSYEDDPESRPVVQIGDLITNWKGNVVLFKIDVEYLCSA